MAKSGYAFAALVVALVAAALVVRPWLGAQGRALVVVGTTVHAPGFTWLVKRVTDAPRLTEEIIGGVTATVVRPKTRAPVIVLFTGAAERGRRDPNVRALAEGFARSGYVVVLPDLPGLTRGELTLRTVRAAETVATESKAVAFFGLSTGGAVAMLVAERRSMRDLVRLVAAMGAFTDIRAVLRLATTHTYRVGLRLRPHP